MTARGNGRRAGASLSALLLALALASCTVVDESPTSLTPGEAAHALGDVPTTQETSGSLRLPYTDIRVSSSEVLDEIPATDTRPRALEAPDGLGIVVVRVAEQPQSPLDTVSAPLMLGRESHLVRIVNADQVTELPPVVGSTYFVAVDPEQPILAEVELDGVAQRVDVRSGEREVPEIAQPLYEPGPGTWPQQSCELTADDPDVPALCWARVSTTPWLPEVGWAEEGRPWWTVAVGASLRGADRSEPDAGSTTVGATLADAPSLDVTARRANVAYLAFPAPDDATEALLSLRVTVPGAAGGDDTVLTGTSRVQAP